VLVPLVVAAAPGASRAAEEPPSISVTGTGRVSAAPNLARVQAGVTTEAARAEDAVRANNAAMQKVVAALGEAGIESRHVQTSRFDVFPIFDQSDPRVQGGPPRITGYRASNQVQVEVHGVEKVGSVLDALVAAGANEIGGITFDVAEPAPLLDQARRLAWADARRKAALYAGEAGATLGRVLRIDETLDRGGPIPMAYARAEMAADKAPISAGELDLTVTVTASWAIGP
jgi:uncharacterized protein YggE